MTTHSLLGFAKDVAKWQVELDLWQEEAMGHACKIVEDEAKRVIGTYDYGWPELAAATKADRVSKGFAENEPLLRTGEMRDSIEHTVAREFLETIGYVGTNNEIAVYQELGTTKIPPRSFLAQAAIHKESEVVLKLGGIMHSKLVTLLG